MSDDALTAAADLETVRQLRAALDAALAENDAWRTTGAETARAYVLAEGRVRELETQLGTAQAEITRLEAALRWAAEMKTIKGARVIVAQTLPEGGF